MKIHNIEIKLAVADAEEARAAIERIADGPPTRLEQTDTYFDAGSYALLKLRRESVDGGAPAARLIAYRRTLGGNPEPSDIRLVEVEDGDGLNDALAHALDVIAVVRKTRHLYFRDQTRIHLDSVEGLGAFVELEVVLRTDQSEADGRRIAADLLDRLSLAGATPQNASYRDLIRSADGAKASNRGPRVPRGDPAGG